MQRCRNSYIQGIVPFNLILNVVTFVFLFNFNFLLFFLVDLLKFPYFPDTELPRINYNRHNGKKYRYFYASSGASDRVSLVP